MGELVDPVAEAERRAATYPERLVGYEDESPEQIERDLAWFAWARRNPKFNYSEFRIGFEDGWDAARKTWAGTQCESAGTDD